jgi:hypothetical protein
MFCQVGLAARDPFPSPLPKCLGLQACTGTPSHQSSSLKINVLLLLIKVLLNIADFVCLIDKNKSKLLFY